MTVRSNDRQAVYQARIDGSGRIVLPVELRSSLGVSFGDSILLVRDDLGVHVETPEQARDALRSYFKALAPSDVSFASEVIAERRAEAERE